MELKFVAGVTPIVRDLDASLAFYRDTLGVPVGNSEDHPEYFATDDMPGLKHIGLWRLEDAAVACFGSPEWPAGMPVPQATIEFDVDDVATAAQEMVAAGYTLVHEPRTEPWGQELARVMSPEGLLIGLTYTPWMRD